MGRLTGAMTAVLVCLVWIVAAVQASDPVPDMSWEKDWNNWRKTDKVSLQEWRDAIPPPAPFSTPLEKWANMTAVEKDELMQTCLEEEGTDFSKHVLTYRSPRLNEVQDAVNKVIKERNITVTAVVFYGRARYVSLLWQYLERNLRSQYGILDKIIMVTKDRDGAEGHVMAVEMLESMKAKYPGVVEEIPFCPKAYGCAYDAYMTDKQTVYVKVDDDIIFIKDGSIEHLVYQQLTNKDYAFYSASIVNNPHGWGVHALAGAHPPTLYHWRDTSFSASHPFVRPGRAYGVYYGKNVYDTVGSRSHESFIYNAAHGKLRAYAFDVWNMHQCKCGKGQEGLDMCHGGLYRWSINGFVFTRNVSEQALPSRVPNFDEPFIGMGWVHKAPPHRVGIVGESLFVHAQYTRQRSSKPDFGLREEILLPWYHVFTRQYMASPYGEWGGNSTLLDVYKRIAWLHGEDPFSRWPKGNRFKGHLADHIDM